MSYFTKFAPDQLHPLCVEDHDDSEKESLKWIDDVKDTDVLVGREVPICPRDEEGYYFSHPRNAHDEEDLGNYL